jgi:PTH1 family peptidyl-tRNA hydrolase
MNESGKPVADLARYYRWSPQEILVVCDDFSIPLGTPRIRLGGSSGGHNGLDSIIQELGTSEIPRLRGGIGPVPPGQDPADFVLEPFAGRDQVAKVELFIPLLAKIVDDIVTKGLEFAMNQYNNKGL